MGWITLLGGIIQEGYIIIVGRVGYLAGRAILCVELSRPVGRITLLGWGLSYWVGPSRRAIIVLG